MPEITKFYLTTAIDYPNSRPHIGTAFEKIGADVQARYRRMEGYDVFFLMGNDENTIKVAKTRRRAGPRAQGVLRRHGPAVPGSLAGPRDQLRRFHPDQRAAPPRRLPQVHPEGVRQRLHLQGQLRGLYCEGCEAFKTEKELEEAGSCPIHQTPCRRAQRAVLLLRLVEVPGPAAASSTTSTRTSSSRRAAATRSSAWCRAELQDVNITRTGQTWGIRVPFDAEFTIYVWFDALLNYITAIGYGTDEERFRKWWPADMHFIGKDITRFHCALWPAMLMAAESGAAAHGLRPRLRLPQERGPARRDQQDAGQRRRADGHHHQVQRRGVPLLLPARVPVSAATASSAGSASSEVYNADLANNLGNLYSRVVTLIAQNYGGRLEGTAGPNRRDLHRGGHRDDGAAGAEPHRGLPVQPGAANGSGGRSSTRPTSTPTSKEPWKLVKTDKEAAKRVLYDLVEQLRAVAILLKPFLPRTAETIYHSFNFPQPWEEVRHEDVWVHPGRGKTCACWRRWRAAR